MRLSCGRRCISARTKRRSTRRSAEPYTLTAIAAPLRSCPPANELPALRMLMHGDRRRVHARREARVRQCRIAMEAAARLRVGRRSLWSPGYFRVDLGRAQSVDAGRLDRVVGSDRRAASRRAAAAAESERRRRLLAHRRRRGEDRPSRASWCSRPINSSSRRPDASRKRRARAAAGDEVRTVIAGYHWFTDWGRDTMISLEGLTL